MNSNYSVNIQRRRELLIPGYTTLKDAGMDGDYVSPIQIISNSLDGPCIVAKDWLDEPSVSENYSTLKRFGYLPGMKFNNVLDLALQFAGLKRSDVYITQVFHLLSRQRSGTIPAVHLRESFDKVTAFELRGRRVVALGTAAVAECRRYGLSFFEAPHPSGRVGSNENRAHDIARALKKAAN